MTPCLGLDDPALVGPVACLVWTGYTIIKKKTRDEKREERREKKEERRKKKEERRKKKEERRKKKEERKSICGTKRV